MMPINIFVALVLLYSLVSGRLEKSVITAPIVFTIAGILMSTVPFGFQSLKIGLDVFLKMAELGLVLLLFTDASQTQREELKNFRNLPTRLLGIGMLLTIILGILCALIIFPGLSFWEAGILASILAPTDAGLGQIIVNSPRVPKQIRQALNVEAGLNDGLSVPFMLFFRALGGDSGESQRASLIHFMIEQLGYGTLVGVGIGLIGGLLLGFVHRRHWITKAWQPLGLVALPVLCMLVSEIVGASMFIAAFVAGLAVQVGFKEAGNHSVEFTEGWGQLLNLSIFFLFGMVVGRDWNLFTWGFLLYAILSLTVVRMLPVAISLIGTRLNRATVLFIGWFGPRGLASIVLGLVGLEQGLHQSGESTVKLAVIVTVFISIFAHGLSAMPGIEFYARKVKKMPVTAHERLNTT
jgi:sodium/hydrogen antiporter